MLPALFIIFIIIFFYILPGARTSDKVKIT